MMLVVYRAAAAVGWLAHVVGRVLASAVWFAPRTIPWVLVLASLTALWAWRSIEDARAITVAAPRPVPAGVADIVDLRALGWVGTSTIVRGPFLDSRSYGAPVQRWYYLLLDPRDDAVAIVARSPSRLEERRTRTIAARVTDDPPAVADAVAGLDGEVPGVDPRRYLVELDDRPLRLTGAGVMTPVSLASNDGTVITLRGEFQRARAVDGAWEYVVRDGGRAVIVRSPHPPDALPVDVWGVAATDRLRTEQALAVPALQAAAGGRRIPDSRLLAEGVTPPLPSVSYVLPMLLAAIAALLVLGWLLGYPLVRRRPLPAGVRTWPLSVGEEIAADLYGVERRGSDRVAVDGAPARLALLPPDELERRRWQYSLREAAGGAPGPGGTASGGVPRLALSSGQGPILLALDPVPPGFGITAGDMIHAGRVRPALRIRAEALDLVAAFASAADRDRAVVAIDPARMGEARSGPPPARAAPSPAAADAVTTPTPIRTAAIILAAVGATFLAGGAIGIPSALADPAGGLAPTLAQLAAGAGVVAVARGVWLRRDWAAALGFNVAWVGAAAAAFLVVAAPRCGLWLSPNLAACEAAGPLGSAAALGAVIGLAYAAFAIRRHAPAFMR